MKDGFLHKFPYRWTLKNAIFTKDKGKVFSCFACGGGSTMGYKLAGFDVIGCNEIDPKMMDAYIVNHNPKHSFLEPIQDFKNRNDLPDELYNLDILDGSPPCSSFSTAGNRDKDWGKEKMFSEGQSKQVLDTLFFDFIDLAKKLQPKIVVAENVKGLLLGKAQKYVARILQEFDSAGYYVQYWLLNASKMGVPQRRERVFFIALRKDLANKFMKRKTLYDDAPELKLEFNEPSIPFNLIDDEKGSPLTELYHSRWEKRIITDNNFGDITKRIGGVAKCFSDKLLHKTKVAHTVTSSCSLVSYDTGLLVSDECLKKIGSFPTDYNFLSNDPQRLIGMSVPPVMVAQIASEIYDQWLSKMP